LGKSVHVSRPFYEIAVYFIQLDFPGLSLTIPSCGDFENWEFRTKVACVVDLCLKHTRRGTGSESPHSRTQFGKLMNIGEKSH
jgi:hypothetical protein